MEIIDLESENDVPRDFTGICRHPKGTLVWYKNGLVHREDGPAIMYYNGKRGWYWEGYLSSPMEVFDQLTDEQKEKVIWDLDQWK